MKTIQRKIYKTMTADGKRYRTHRYLMQQHIGRELGCDEIVHHINGDTLDNRIENLQIMGLAEHAESHGVFHVATEEKRRRGLLCMTAAKLTELDIPVIRKLLLEGKSMISIAKMFDVSRRSIDKIKRRETWIHVN